MRNNTKSSQPPGIQKSCCSLGRGTFSSVLSPSARRADEAPVRPERAGGLSWCREPCLCSGQMWLAPGPISGQLGGAQRASPSRTLGVLHRKTQSCRGPCLRVVAVTRKEAKKGQGSFRRSPLPPGVTRLLLSVRTNVVLSGRFRVTDLRLPLQQCGDLGVLGGQDSPLEKLGQNKTLEKRWF